MAFSAANFFLQSSSLYSVPYSLRFRASNSARLTRTFGSPTNNLLWAWNASVKRGTLGAQQILFCSNGGGGTNYLQIYFNSDDTIKVFQDNGGATTLNVATSAVFRDPSAWLNIFVIYDSANATANDRIQIWVNGVRQTVSYTTGPVSLNQASAANVNARDHAIGYFPFTGAQYFDGFQAEVRFIDGQAGITASSFGQTSAASGQWVPKAYTGTYGTNGFYLKFADASAATAAAIGKDSSGNGNNWTPSGISVTAGVTFDQMTDTPTNNYAVLNPLRRSQNTISTISNGNLRAVSPNIAFFPRAIASIGMEDSTSLGWYCEFEYTNDSSNVSGFGITTASAYVNDVQGLGGSAVEWGYQPSSSGSNGNVRNNNVNLLTGLTSWTTGGYGMIAYKNGSLWLGVNGTWFNSGNPAAGTGALYTGLTGPMFPVTVQGNTSDIIDANFGQRAFRGAAPSSFLALNTTNLSTPSIQNGASQFQATTRTGTGAIASVSSLAFQPDLVWIKSRSNATNNILFDSTRGTTDYLISNSTAAAATNANTLTAFNSNGYTLGTDAGSVGVNINTNTYVDWSWKKGVTPGFDIVAYTGNGSSGRTVSHALGATPHMYIVKRRDAGANNWAVYHRNMNASPATGYLLMNSTAAFATNATYWNNTVPTSSVFTVDTTTDVNANTATYITYLWTSIPGFSLMGSYTGNGSADGPFVWCGFKPRFILFKNASAVGSWLILDTARNTFNVMNGSLYADVSDAESTATNRADATANGFKIRDSNTLINGSSHTIIFAAFAESPFKYATAR